ncbi:cobalamin biosynthesis protein CbiX [Salmonella enterica subsp. enterica serovar Enteritidis]|nr:cobalamin biosynthesis protein CbiX [Salmonella enterica]ECT8230240.1 cobalamin biosynthesis protein CbiX [Salmonella enterica subsp. enterica serovar Enteritidis]EEW1918390.1 cobalamin biosynthesis protein CbiX [Escherichia coli]EHP6398620.1 cobalamin biosynthesis protein CbiX [Escherichia coli]EKM9681562.1 cobalamin biosynthesis protein CbiX [Escherichia coli]
MHFTTFLKKHFDVEYEPESFIKPGSTDDTGKDVDAIWLYEENNDCEPIFILHEAWWITDTKEKRWIVGNVYSALEHGKEYSEKELINIIKSGKFKK